MTITINDRVRVNKHVDGYDENDELWGYVSGLTWDPTTMLVMHIEVQLIWGGYRAERVECQLDEITKF